MHDFVEIETVVAVEVVKAGGVVLNQVGEGNGRIPQNEQAGNLLVLVLIC